VSRFLRCPAQRLNRRTNQILIMKSKSPTLTEADFINLITRGASQLTPNAVQQLVSDLPDLRERFGQLREAGYPDAEQQLTFLSQVVELVWTDQYRDMPYGAALEAAFAVTYFAREGDLIPDTLGAIGLIDDIAVVQTVLMRNIAAFEALAITTKLPPVIFASGPAA
jgi:uncharacterized membrane protein YkvA (DUF1232 family)